MTEIPRVLMAASVVACLAITGLAQTSPIPVCMQGSVLPPFGDAAQGSVALWPNGIAPDGAAGYYIPPFTLAASNPRLMGPLNTEPLVTNFVAAPLVTANAGRSLFVYVQTPMVLGDANILTQVQSFPFGSSITDWLPTSAHFLFMFIRVNGSPWTLVGEFELAPISVPGIGFGGNCGMPIIMNVGWWTGQRIFSNSGTLTEDKPAAAWVGIRTNTPGTFNVGDTVDVMGIWAIEEVPGTSPGGLATVHVRRTFTSVVH